MSKKKTILIAVLVIIVALALFITIRPSREDTIISFVGKYEVQLKEVADHELNGDHSTTSFKGVKVDGVFTNDHGGTIVQFFYAGTGLVPSSKYYGFYYSPEDIPAAFQNADMKLEGGNGVWRWSDTGDNGGITKEIGNGWYYYEAWF